MSVSNNPPQTELSILGGAQLIAICICTLLIATITTEIWIQFRCSLWQISQPFVLKYWVMKLAHIQVLKKRMHEARIIFVCLFVWLYVCLFVLKQQLYSICWHIACADIHIQYRSIYSIFAQRHNIFNFSCWLKHIQFIVI